MRENLIQGGERGSDGRLHIDGDWYDRGIPPNVRTAAGVYLDTSYGFAAFHSTLPEAMFIDQASGCYDRATFVTGTEGAIRIGKFTILNGATLICHRSIVIGDHCMLAWGSVITDTWLDPAAPPHDVRRRLLRESAREVHRPLPRMGEPHGVVLEDNVWVGFDAVVLPGVRLGRGCLVGSKSIVTEEVPPYAVVAGNPARIIRYLAADDTEEAKAQAMKQYLAR